MDGYRLLDILVQFIQRSALGKNVLPDSAGTPELTIKIGLYFYQHVNLPQGFQAYYSRNFGFWLDATLFIALVNFYAMPMAGSIMQQPVKEAALLAKKNNYHVVMWAASYPSFAVYREEIIAERQPRGGDIILTKANKLKNIKQHRIIYQKNGIVLARVIVP